MSDLFSAYKTSDARNWGPSSGEEGVGDHDIYGGFNFPSYKVEYNSPTEYALWLVECRGLDEDDAQDTARQVWNRENREGFLATIETGRME